MNEKKKETKCLLTTIITFGEGYCDGYCDGYNDPKDHKEMLLYKDDTYQCGYRKGWNSGKKSRDCNSN